MSYLLANAGAVFWLALQHIGIALSAVVLASLIGVPVGIVISRVRAIETLVLMIAGLLYLIPSLALFAFLIPIFGLGFRSAVVALVLYSLLVVIRNTSTGLKSLADPVREAATGIGMSGMQKLWLVELPLAFPIILGGIRIATVMNIGIAAIAAYIGAGGLGSLIFRGIATVDSDLILAGVVPIALLALSADHALRKAEAALRRG